MFDDKLRELFPLVLCFVKNILLFRLRRRQRRGVEIYRGKILKIEKGNFLKKFRGVNFYRPILRHLL